jgi:hypothetical protein
LVSPYQRASPTAANRERIMALPDSYLDAEFTKVDTLAAGVRDADQSEPNDAE